MIYPNLRHLEIFLTLCEVGSVSKTARQMHMTQPAVSKAILNLEETMRLRLFDRRKNRLYLNPIGIRLRDEAERLLNQVRLFTNDVEALQNARRGHLTVVSIPSLAFGAVADAVGTFNHSHSDVTVSFNIQMSQKVVEMVSQKRADIGFIHGSSGNSHVAETYLLDSEIGCLMSANHPLVQYQEVTPETLADYPLVFFDVDSPLNALVRDAFARAGIQPKIQTEVNASLLANSIVSNETIALVDPYSIPTNPRLTLLPFSPRIPLSIFMITGKGYSNNSLVSAFATTAFRAISQSIGKTRN